MLIVKRVSSGKHTNEYPIDGKVRLDDDVCSEWSLYIICDVVGYFVGPWVEYVVGDDVGSGLGCDVGWGVGDDVGWGVGDDDGLIYLILGDIVGSFVLLKILSKLFCVSFVINVGERIGTLLLNTFS